MLDQDEAAEHRPLRNNRARDVLIPERVLSGKVVLAGLAGNEGVLEEGGAAGQVIAGVPAAARQVAKRSARA